MSCTSPDPPAYCSAASPELKLYQAFIFSVPVFFTFVLLLVFYLFYLRRWRASWQSLRMRANHLSRGDLQRVSKLFMISHSLICSTYAAKKFVFWFIFVCAFSRRRRGLRKRLGRCSRWSCSRRAFWSERHSEWFPLSYVESVTIHLASWFACSNRFDLLTNYNASS